MPNQHDHLKESSPLGKTTVYIDQYDANLLFAIPRALKRKEVGIHEKLPFIGFDIWNSYELSWLNSKGKPVVAIATFEVPCESNNIFESKSLKLYLGSFSGTQFSSKQLGR